MCKLREYDLCPEIVLCLVRKLKCCPCNAVADIRLKRSSAWSRRRCTGMNVSLVAREHGVAPSLLFRWRKLSSQGALQAVGADESVVPASEYKALQQQVRELHRLLGKKTLENEILKEATEVAREEKVARALIVIDGGRFSVAAVCRTLGVARSNIAHRRARGAHWRRDRRGRPPCEDSAVLEGSFAPWRCSGRPTDIGGFGHCCGGSAALQGCRRSTPSVFIAW